MKELFVSILALLLWSPLPARAAPDPGSATTISVVSTLVPCAVALAATASDSPELGWSVAAAGVYVGPAAGYFYGGLAGRGFAGIGYRAAFSVIGLWGVGRALSETNDSVAVPVAIIAGGIGLAGSVVYDIATLDGRVRARNERIVMVVPWRSSEGSPGLALHVSF